MPCSSAPCLWIPALFYFPEGYVSQLWCPPTIGACRFLLICEMKLQLLFWHLADEYFQQTANNKQCIVSLPDKEVTRREAQRNKTSAMLNLDHASNRKNIHFRLEKWVPRGEGRKRQVLKQGDFSWCYSKKTPNVCKGSIFIFPQRMQPYS